MRFGTRLCATLALACLPTLSLAQSVKPVPPLINFQGKLTKPDGTNVATGKYDIRFSLWDAPTGGTEKWFQAFSRVDVRSGAFSVLLNGFPDDLFNDNLWLEMKVGTDDPITPRQQVASVAFAFKANTVPDGAITADKIADGAITSKKLEKSFLTAGGDLAGAYPNPTLGILASSLAKVSGNYLFSSGGKIGVNTKSPQARLHVLGDGRIFNLEGKTSAFMSLYPLGYKAGEKGQFGFTTANTKDLSIVNSAGGSLILDAPTVMVKGGIQSGGTPINTTDMGLYSQNPGWMRFVTTNSVFQWYSDGGIGTNPIMTLGPDGHVWLNHLDVGGHLELAKYLHVVGDTSIDGNFNLAGGNVRHMAVGANGVGDGIGIQGTGTNSPSLSLWKGSNTQAHLGIALANGHFSNWATLDDTVLKSVAGRLILQSGEGDGTVSINGRNVGIGTPNPQALLDVNGTLLAKEVQVSGSDVAEPYHISATQNQKPIPGMVVVIDPNSVGKMRISSHTYDKTVGGIISGANGVKPGLILRQPGTVADGKYPVASSGRVWCYCDAGAGGAIKPGDLLTTSPTPGHAMKATNYRKAQGAVLGKAMSSLKSGRGMVLVLVTLQ